MWQGGEQSREGREIISTIETIIEVYSVRADERLCWRRGRTVGSLHYSEVIHMVSTAEREWHHIFSVTAAMALPIYPILAFMRQYYWPCHFASTRVRADWPPWAKTWESRRSLTSDEKPFHGRATARRWLHPPAGDWQEGGRYRRTIKGGGVFCPFFLVFLFLFLAKRHLTILPLSHYQ